MATGIRHVLLGVPAALAVAIALRLFRLGDQSLWIDELISLQLATYATGLEFWRGLLTDIHGPFNSAILHGWTRLGGTGETWLRLLYVAPAVATIPLAARLGERLFDARTGRITAWLFAVSPFHVWYSQEVRSYAWVLLFLVAALILFLRVWDGRWGRGTWVGLAALIALSLLTNFSAVFLVVGLSAAVLLRRPFSGPLATRWAAVLTFSGLVFLPWFLDWYRRIGGERIFVDAASPTGMPLREDSGFSWKEVPYTLWSFAYGYSLGPPLRELHLDRSWRALSPHLPVVALGTAALFIPLRTGWSATLARGRSGLLVAIVAAPLALAVLLAARGVKTFHPRYLVVLFPVFLSVLAAGWSRGPRGGRLTALVAGALVAVSLLQWWTDPAYAKEDSRGAARVILENEQPGDSVVVIYAFRPFRHYFADTANGRARLCHVHKRFLKTDEDLRAHVDEASAGAGRVWLVLSRWWDVGPEDRIRRAFESRLVEVRRWEVPGVKVTLYESPRS